MTDAWESLKRECLNCRRCGLWETRTNVVFGVGAPDAEVLFIGEGPGEQEDLQGEPFVGRLPLPHARTQKKDEGVRSLQC